MLKFLGIFDALFLKFEQNKEICLKVLTLTKFYASVIRL